LANGSLLVSELFGMNALACVTVGTDRSAKAEADRSLEVRAVGVVALMSALEVLLLIERSNTKCCPSRADLGLLALDGDPHRLGIGRRSLLGLLGALVTDNLDEAIGIGSSGGSSGGCSGGSCGTRTSLKSVGHTDRLGLSLGSRKIGLGGCDVGLHHVARCGTRTSLKSVGHTDRLGLSLGSRKIKRGGGQAPGGTVFLAAIYKGHSTGIRKRSRFNMRISHICH
jgi:hypothetical protein